MLFNMATAVLVNLSNRIVWTPRSRGKIQGKLANTRA